MPSPQPQSSPRTGLASSIVHDLAFQLSGERERKIKAYVQAFRSMISALRGKTRTAAELTLWRMGYHVRQVISGEECLEICPAYIARQGELTHGTSTRGYQAIAGVLAEFRSSPEETRCRGFGLRKLGRARRWGQHFILPAAVAEAARQASDLLGILAPPDGSVDSWTPVVTVRRGARQIARCPFHDDKRPSMLLNPNGSGVCFACRGADGGKLTVRWRATSDGQVLLRRSRKSAGSARGGVDFELEPSDLEDPAGEEDHGPDTYGAQEVNGRFLLAKHSGSSFNRSPSRAGDLLHLLDLEDRRAPRRMDGARASAMMWLGSEVEDPRVFVRDPLVSLDEYRPTLWAERRFRGKEVSVPVSWSVSGTRYVAVDIDDLDATPLGLSSFEVLNERIRDGLRGHNTLWRALTGRYRVVWTSPGKGGGVQAVFELRLNRGPGEAWHRSGEGRDVAQRLDALVLDALHDQGFEGGVADQSVHASGRYIRRPGPRITSTGILWNARVIGGN